MKRRGTDAVLLEPNAPTLSPCGGSCGRGCGCAFARELATLRRLLAKVPGDPPPLADRRARTQARWRRYRERQAAAS